ncbi:MAG: hypothetical protein ACXVB6_21420, partial [Mucilaginibacter sp.]
MKTYLKIALLLLFPVAGMAQDTTVTIKPTMFDKVSDQLYLSALSGWIFKQGNDTAWARKDIDIGGWKKLKPTDLSAKYADKNGKAECWFRIKVKIDKGFGEKEFGFKSSAWAASDLYIDGKLVNSFGNTGANGKAFKEFSAPGNLSLPANLKPGNEYTIALHFVDYLSPFSSRRLKSEDAGLISLIRLTGPAYNSYFIVNTIQIPVIYSTVWISVCAILSFLFWLLSIQNSFEKNLRRVALGSTFLTLALSCLSVSQTGIGISYTGFIAYVLAANFFNNLAWVMIVLIIAGIFKRNIPRILKFSLIVFFSGSVISQFLPNRIGNPLFLCLISLPAVGCIYYISSSWKSLKGAQWATVIGLLFSLGCGVFYLYMIGLYHVRNERFSHLFLTGYALSFPLSLLVYVAMRFKEIIGEVQQQAQQVVQLSDEKKEQALN